MADKDLLPVKRCPECDRTMCAQHSWKRGNRRGAETYWWDGTGLCRACSTRKKRREYRAANPLPPRPRRATHTGPTGPNEETDYYLTEYDMIRDSVGHIRDAASRLGISFSRLDKMLYRARQRDDPRGRPPAQQLERAIDRGMPFGREHPHRPYYPNEAA